MPVITFSPIEVFADVLKQLVDPMIVPNVVGGPLSHDQQQDGGASIMDSGAGNEELYLPLVRPRMQVRCIAPTLSQCEIIGRHIGFAVQDYPGRLIGTQESDGHQYLVHTMTGSGGPSAHKDTEGTWEYLIFVETMMGTTPVA